MTANIFILTVKYTTFPSWFPFILFSSFLFSILKNGLFYSKNLLYNEGLLTPHPAQAGGRGFDFGMSFYVELCQLSSWALCLTAVGYLTQPIDFLGALLPPQQVHTLLPVCTILLDQDPDYLQALEILFTNGIVY